MSTSLFYCDKWEQLSYNGVFLLAENFIWKLRRCLKETCCVQGRTLAALRTVEEIL